MSEIDKAIKTAEQIGAAVAKKFPKYESNVRRYETGGDMGFIEIAIKPEGGSRVQELATAYSDEFFMSATKENVNDKAKRILHDFRILAGVKAK